VSDISADGGGAVLFTSPAGAPASMPDVPPVTLDFNFLGRTWRLVVSPSQTLADATNAALLSRSLSLGVPCTALAAICSVIIAIFVRRNRREAREGSSFEAYVSAASQSGIRVALLYVRVAAPRAACSVFSCAA
jgi:hypothetical protein